MLPRRELAAVLLRCTEPKFAGTDVELAGCFARAAAVDATELEPVQQLACVAPYWR